MAGDDRKKNINWTIAPNADGSVTLDQAQLAVLMDIRDELQETKRANGFHFATIVKELRGLRRDLKKKI